MNLLDSLLCVVVTASLGGAGLYGLVVMAIGQPRKVDQLATPPEPYPLDVIGDFYADDLQLAELRRMFAEPAIPDSARNTLGGRP